MKKERSSGATLSYATDTKEKNIVRSSKDYRVLMKLRFFFSKNAQYLRNNYIFYTTTKSFRSHRPH